MTKTPLEELRGAISYAREASDLAHKVLDSTYDDLRDIINAIKSVENHLNTSYDAVVEAINDLNEHITEQCTELGALKKEVELLRDRIWKLENMPEDAMDFEQ